jgi:hypothetical protein
MLDFSPAGLAGAVIGTGIAAVAYRWLVALLDRGLRAQTRSAGGENRSPLERALLLRVVLATDIVIFAGLGYWLGVTIWG